VPTNQGHETGEGEAEQVNMSVHEEE